MLGRSGNRLLQQLEVLTRHRVEFIVIGGVAAIFEGAPITTLDLDIVHNSEPENLSRLVVALQEIDAYYKDPAGRHIVPDADRLASHRLNLLLTDLGGLDILRVVGADKTYEDLLQHSSLYEVEGMRVRVLNLEVIIELKEAANRDKDRATLPILRRTLDLKRR